MGADQNLDWRAAAASALDWWRDAGVDVAVGDSPHDWFAPEPDGAPAPTPAARNTPAAPATVPAVALPHDLPDFFAWRGGPDAPEAGWSGTAIAAAGPADADIMVLVDCPERDDADMLMGGETGRLFDRMLAAIGHGRADVHLAAVCARRPTGGRMPHHTEARLGEIARHHVALAGPRRLLVLGDAASRALLSANVGEARGRLHALNHKDGKMTEAVASFHPRFLLGKPAAKAEAWKDLQMLIGGMK